MFPSVMFAALLLLPLIIAKSHPLNFTRPNYPLYDQAPPAITCVQYNEETQALEHAVCESFAQGAYWMWPVCNVFYTDGQPAKESMRCWGVDHVQAARCSDACPSIQATHEKKFWQCCCFSDLCNQ